MGDSFFLGIDLGTTMIKAALFRGQDGALVSRAARTLDVRSDADGTREQDPVALDRALVGMAEELRREALDAWEHLAGIGMAAQGGSAMVMDRATGAARTALQLWNDTRPLSLLDEARALRPPEYWRNLSGRSAPGAGLARIRWWRREAPDAWDGAALYGGAGEYLFHRLTGVWRQDAGNALQIGCYDARKQCLVAEPLADAGLALDAVAPLRHGHETHLLMPAMAEALGLPAGLPVAGPYMDHEAGFLAAREAGRDVLQVSLGTAWVGNFLEPSDAPWREGAELRLPSPVDDAALTVRVMFAGNVTWDWALKTFAASDAPGAIGDSRSVEEARARAAAIFQERLLPNRGLLALPWLTWSNPLVGGASGFGGFLGVGPETDAAELLRASALGLVCELRRMLGPVLADASFDRVVLMGGVTRVPAFRTLIAAALFPAQLDVVLPGEEAGPRGTLFALDERLARARTESVDEPSAALRDSMAERMADYEAACRMLAAGLPDSGRMLLL